MIKVEVTTLAKMANVYPNIYADYEEVKNIEAKNARDI
jgi:hypothetical protein